MPRQPRNFRANSFYHIYNRGNNKDPVLKFSSDKQLFISLLFKFKDTCDIHIVKYCIMDTHFHLIVRTRNNPRNLSKYMQKVTASYASQINRKYQRVGHVFQDRFSANLLPYKKDLRHATIYVLRNPVVEGLVRKPSEYPWSNGK